MFRCLSFILGGLVALRLHTGTITPLQLALKIGDVPSCRDEAGIVLMGSIDLSRCFNDVISLVNVKTLPFRKSFTRTCKDRFSLDSMKRYDRNTVAYDLGLAKYMGVDCTAEIQDYGKTFSNQSLDSIPVNSWTKMINLSKLQIEEVLLRLSDPDRTNDILFTGFLLFDRVFDVEIVTSLFQHYRDIFDGPFVEFNSNHANVLVPTFLRIESKSRPHHRFIDIGEIPTGKFSRKAHSLIKKKNGVELSSIDMISRFMQLASAHVYTSNSCRASMSVAALRRIKSVVMALFHFVMVHYQSFGCWRVAVRAAAHLARATVESEFSLVEFYGFVPNSEAAHKGSGFYGMILEMVDHVVEAKEALSNAFASMIVRMKIEALVVLSRFNVPQSKMLEFVEGILGKHLDLGVTKRKPLCRHLLVLLWALGSNKTPFKDSCKLLMSYILYHMPSGTDMDTFKRLGVFRYAPFKILQRAARQNLSNCISEGMFEEALELCNLGIIGPRHSMMDPSGYIDIQEARKLVVSKLFPIIQNNFVYCGHYDGVPMYFQSLGCHQSVSSLIQPLIFMAAGLRLGLPFTLHPSIISKIAEPDSRENAEDYLMTAIKYEFGMALPRGVVETKVARILGLLDQTTASLKGDEGECDSHADWESRIAKYHWLNLRKKISLMKEWLRALGTDLVKRNVMPINCDGKFESALMAIPGLNKILLKDW